MQMKFSFFSHAKEEDISKDTSKNTLKQEDQTTTTDEHQKQDHSKNANEREDSQDDEDDEDDEDEDDDDDDDEPDEWYAYKLE
ncbi:unnamed protein product [Ambrosiozyma monospora]|uniref:Unnamed protein product n=1 Tax=Ambrosiozyma monospora TaxID=43982 RepID=A0A9W6Z542_AMBMO|nr:unnamed protein product [Ambrosiozyma monospora]